VASGGISTDLVLWDLDSGATQSLTGHSAFIRWIDYSPQGTVIATVAWDGQLMLWDRATGERYPIVHSDSVAGETELGLSVHGVDELLYVEFSPTGQYLATTSSDHTAIIWEVDYLAEQGVRLTRLITLRGHTDWVHAATFNQAETMVATASQDNKIFLWSLVNTPDYSVGEKIAELTGHRDSVNAIDFSPDGLRLASGSTDGAVIIWNIDVARAPLILCEQVNRDLTEDEWLERIGTGREYHPTCLEYTGGETIEE
jgi:WD40 repeat protein